MLLLKSADQLQHFIRREKENGKKIGFVPTMGALHEGHLSLIDRANEENDHSVCSIFVNPTQFNDPKDLEKYPRTEGNDIYLLDKNNCHILFLPSVEEIYPDGIKPTVTYHFGKLETVMEGAFRPGHFAGVAQVVSRLLDLVKPDALYMGQKDFQQFSIVKNMLMHQQSPVRLVMCPTLRESSGLAMSSRNMRLSENGKNRAALIYQTLVAVKDTMDKQSPETLQKWAFQQLSTAGFDPEYFEIADGDTLQPVQNFKDSPFIVACTAAWVEGVRLIDNLVLKNAD